MDNERYAGIIDALKKEERTDGLFKTAIEFMILVDSAQTSVPELYEKMKGVSFLRVVGTSNQFFSCGQSKVYRAGDIKIGLYRYGSDDKLRCVLTDTTNKQPPVLTAYGKEFDAISICWLSESELDSFRKSVRTLFWSEPNRVLYYTAGSDTATLRVAVVTDQRQSSGCLDDGDTHEFD